MSRTFSNAVKNIGRSPYQALASVLILTITFFIAQAFLLISLGSQQVLKFFETRPQVTAFFTDQIDEPAILQLKSQLEKEAYVSGVTYVSKEHALQIYRDQNKDDPLMLEMVTANILPPSIEVSAISVEYLPKIKEYLTGVRGVEQVVYQQDVIDAMQKWTNGIRFAGLGLVVFLSVTSLLVITIIISMKVSSKRREIATMRLLGATQWFIKGPFITEGALYGMSSAFIAWGLTYVGILYATPTLLDFLGEIPVLPVNTEVMLMLLGGSMFSGMLMGMVSGSISTSRFEK